jgi:hypothetical protein
MVNIKPLHILVIPAVVITSHVASLIGTQLAEERSIKAVVNL